MDKTQVIDYLRIVSQVEGELYTLRATKDEYERTIRTLCVPVGISIPQRQSPPQSEFDKATRDVPSPKYSDSLKREDLRYFLFMVIPYFFIPLTFLLSFSCHDNCSDIDTADAACTSACSTTIGALVLYIITAAAVCLIKYCLDKSKDRRAIDIGLKSPGSKNP